MTRRRDKLLTESHADLLSRQHEGCGLRRRGAWQTGHSLRDRPYRPEQSGNDDDDLRQMSHGCSFPFTRPRWLVATLDIFADHDAGTT
jgi:hypothetical protein